MECADVAEFESAGEVIPLHCGWRVRPSTIGARAASFQAYQPLPVRASARSRTSRRGPVVTFVPLMIEDRAALFAIRLHTIPADPVDVKFGERLRHAAAVTVLHLVG